MYDQAIAGRDQPYVGCRDHARTVQSRARSRTHSEGQMWGLTSWCQAMAAAGLAWAAQQPSEAGTPAPVCEQDPQAHPALLLLQAPLCPSVQLPRAVRLLSDWEASTAVARLSAWRALCWAPGAGSSAQRWRHSAARFDTSRPLPARDCRHLLRWPAQRPAWPCLSRKEQVQNPDMQRTRILKVDTEHGAHCPTVHPMPKWHSGLPSLQRAVVN